MVVVGEEETEEADEEAGTREVEIKVVKVSAIPTTPFRSLQITQKIWEICVDMCR